MRSPSVLLTPKECYPLMMKGLWAFLILILSAGCVEANEEKEWQKERFMKERHEMVSNQIEARGIKDPRVLEAMREVERHKFVPSESISFSYGDHPLPIGHEQTISQPYIVAYMTEIMNLKGDEKVLEIGTGSGYQAAVLSKLVKEVYSIEIIRALGERAQKALEEEGYKNVHVKIGDGFLGWPDKAPFDAIIVTAAATDIPPPLVEQLKEGGIMVLPVGDWFQEIVIVRKSGGKIKTERTLPVRFVPLVREAS